MLCGLAFFWMVVVGWRKWADPLVDFGRELYVPWQIAQGKVLYRDIAAIFGPFSQYFNGAVFRVFGASLTTLILTNLIILAGLIVLVYRLLADACDRLTATAACLLLILVLAFSQCGTTANYNFVCPYAHEATHGIVLGVAMIFCLARRPRRPLLMTALAGLCFGAVLLTKAEIAAAAALVLIAWLVIGLTVCRAAMGWNWRCVAVLLAAGLTPSLIFLAYSGTRMPVSQALDGLLKTWTSLTLPGIADNAFYKRCMGIDNLGGNIFTMLKAFAVIVGVAGLVAFVDFAARGQRVLQALIGLVAGGTILTVAAMHLHSEVWLDLFRVTPLVVLVGWCAATVALVRRRRDANDLLRIAPLWLLASFAILLLAKIALHVQFYHYGFYLAMPAALASVVLILWQIPSLLGKGRTRALTFRGAALGAIAAVIAPHLQVSQQVYDRKTLQLGRGGDALRTFSAGFDPTGPVMVRALDHIETRTPADATMVVMPEGVMLNYLSRRVNPTPYTNLMIVEMLAFGEDTILASFKEHRPDYFVLVHKDAGEHGLPPFGSDERYGKSIMDWVNAEYEPMDLIGAEPFQDPRQFGIKILRRRPPDGQPPTPAPAPPPASAPTTQ